MNSVTRWFALTRRCLGRRAWSPWLGTLLLAACSSVTAPPPAAPSPRAVTAPSAAPVVPAAPATTEARPAAEALPPPVATEPPRPPPPVELPDYARRGKRLPPDGGAPGRAVLAYCHAFEIERSAEAYYRRLQRENRLPSAADVAARNQQNGTTLSQRQYVDRDWALRRDNNRSAPQRCKVLGGSIDGATALVVFEADLNGRRQRGTATVVQQNRGWKVRDHGDWAPVK